MTTFDITDMLAPKSDQLDAIELVSGPRTFTIEGVARNNSPEQPLNVSLVGFPRVWRPGLSMRRVLAAGWGQDASVYAGRSVTLYNDPEVTFGRDKTGGTRISHMSHLAKPLTVPLIVKRGQIKPFTVQPLKDAPVQVASTQPTPAAPTAAEVAASTDVDHLRALYRAASPDVRQQITARVAELQKPDPEPEADQPQQPETDEFDPWDNEEQK